MLGPMTSDGNGKSAIGRLWSVTLDCAEPQQLAHPFCSTKG
jgi:hypothetical protein